MPLPHPATRAWTITMRALALPLVGAPLLASVAALGVTIDWFVREGGIEGLVPVGISGLLVVLFGSFLVQTWRNPFPVAPRVGTSPVRASVRSLLLLLGCWTVAVMGGRCVLSQVPPSDARVRVHFEAHVDEFETLLTMLRDDPSVGTIAPDFVMPNGSLLSADVSMLGIGEAGLQEYKRLMDQVDVLRLDRDDDRRVWFALWGAGWGGDTHHKGIGWFAIPPPQVESDRVYTRIRGSWWIFQD